MFVIFVCKSVSVLHICSFELFLDSTCKWYHTVFVFVWLISLSVTFSRHIHVAANGNISFYGWIIFNCVLCVCVRERDIFLKVDYLFVGTWIVSMSWLLYIVLLWTLGCIYLFESEHSWDSGSYGSSIFSFLRKLHNIFHSVSLVYTQNQLE